MNAIGGKAKMIAKGKNGEVIDYIKDADPVKIERELMSVIPRDHWFRFTYEMIDHGRAVCKASNPLCGECRLRELCPSARMKG
ncbi:hypothetical protein HY947_03990 [Candidatus Gottesmanbacteria bacterium]|nr:hypothetical protein [Candidatus Gottesmanbacteria bacterium]